MSYRQLKSPNLSTTDEPGWCLRFTGATFATPARPFQSATEAWNGAKFRHTGSLPNVAVPVYYYWFGTVDGIAKNWGDVAIWVPGKGVFGTPKRGSGRGSRFDPSPQARADWLGGNAKYLGWSEDINGLRVAEAAVVTQPTQGADEMIANTDQATKLYKMLRPNGQPSAAEINGTAGKRSFAEFVNSAQTEIANRDAALRHQAEQVAIAQDTIVQMQRTIMELHSQGTATKQKYDQAIADITKLSDELKSTNDKIMELQNTSQPTVNEPGWFTRLLVKIFAKK